jgi:hypothetical protein
MAGQKFTGNLALDLFSLVTPFGCAKNTSVLWKSIKRFFLTPPSIFEKMKPDI